MSSLQNNKDLILNFKDYLKLNESSSESERLLCVEVFKDIINKINKGPHSLEYSSFRLSVDDEDVRYEASLTSGSDVSIYDIDLHIKLKVNQTNISQDLLKLFKSNEFNINNLSDYTEDDLELMGDLGILIDREIDIYIGTFEIVGRIDEPWSSQDSGDDLQWNIDENDYILINITTDGHDSVETKIYVDDMQEYVTILLDFMDDHSYPESIEWVFMNKK